MKANEIRMNYKGKEYRLEFNLNVMKEIQSKYETIEKWGDLTDATDGKEFDAEAVIFGFTAMINEGIDIANEENGTNEPFKTERQVGRMVTEYGIDRAALMMNEKVISSIADPDDLKNE